MSHFNPLPRPWATWAAHSLLELEKECPSFLTPPNLSSMQISYPAQNESEYQICPIQDQTTLSPYAWCRGAGAEEITGSGEGEMGPHSGLQLGDIKTIVK